MARQQDVISCDVVCIMYSQTEGDCLKQMGINLVRALKYVGHE